VITGYGAMVDPRRLGATASARSDRPAPQLAIVADARSTPGSSGATA
jgi:hypothetical protein